MTHSEPFNSYWPLTGCHYYISWQQIPQYYVLCEKILCTIRPQFFLHFISMDKLKFYFYEMVKNFSVYRLTMHGSLIHFWLLLLPAVIFLISQQYTPESCGLILINSVYSTIMDLQGAKAWKPPSPLGKGGI